MRLIMTPAAFVKAHFFLSFSNNSPSNVLHLTGKNNIHFSFKALGNLAYRKGVFKGV